MRILIISPTPTHPQDAGNRARIFRLAEQLRSFGHNVSFAYSETEMCNTDAMRRYWGDRLFVFPGKTWAMDASMGSRSLSLRFHSWLRGLGEEQANLRSKGWGIDDWCAPGLASAVQQLHAQEQFQMVWVEYVFLSKVLDSFDSSVVKVLDTHDVFSDRHERMVIHGVKPQWFSTTRELEKEGLSRADWVVAIQERDAEFFKTLGLSRVVTIGHFIPVRPAQNFRPENRILFLGSDNPINLKSWEYFTREILGEVKKRLPAVSIQVAGKICSKIPEGAGYRKLGVVEDLDALYTSASVAINPLIWGTGLKIKTIEPLAYGCPVVTTPAGIEGIEEAENQGILVGRTPEEFANWIERLLTSPLLREEQGRSAHKFLKGYLDQNQQRLLGILGSGRLLQEERKI